MDLHSLDDCFVTKLFLVTGNVKLGDSLIQLYSADLEQKLDRIEKFITIANINKRQFIGERYKLSKTLEISNLEVYKKELDRAKGRYEGYHTQFKAGAGTPADENSLRTIYLDLQVTYNKQKLVVDQFEIKNQDGIDKFDSIIDAAICDKGILVDFKAKLLIKAPIDGVFNAECYEGMFYKKGQVLGTFFSQK